MSAQPYSPLPMPTAATRPSFGELVGESLDLLAGFGIMFVALAPFALPFILLLVATALVVLVPLAAVGAACAVLMSPVVVARRVRSHRRSESAQPSAEVVRTRPIEVLGTQPVTPAVEPVSGPR
jgi:hypothetical protein